MLTELASSVWKERLAAMEVAQTKIRADSSLSCQLICRLMMRKPGLKDNNFQVMSYALQLLHFKFSKPLSLIGDFIFFTILNSSSLVVLIGFSVVGKSLHLAKEGNWKLQFIYAEVLKPYFNFLGLANEGGIDRRSTPGPKTRW